MGLGGSGGRSVVLSGGNSSCKQHRHTTDTLISPLISLPPHSPIQVACRWAATREASVELGDLSQSGRAAVGLGRWVLDPLAVLCGVVADEGAAVGLFMGPAEVLLG